MGVCCRGHTTKSVYSDDFVFLHHFAGSPTHYSPFKLEELKWLIQLVMLMEICTTHFGL